MTNWIKIEPGCEMPKEQKGVEIKLGLSMAYAQHCGYWTGTAWVVLGEDGRPMANPDVYAWRYIK
jgi:hypothetical protein